MIALFFFSSFIFFIIFTYLFVAFKPNSHTYSYFLVRCKRNNCARNLFSYIFMVFFDKGFLALAIYRMANKINSALIGKILSRLSEFLTGIEIYYNAKIGRGVEIWHGNGVVIGQSALIGDDVLILQQVTIGGGYVSIGSGSRIGAGAKILGNIRLGKNVAVAANAVVTKSVEDNAFVGGVPAKVLSRDSSRVEFGTNSIAK